MSITKAKKNELIEEYRQSESDTGSTDVQVAVLTSRIRTLTEHLKIHRKDHSARRGLLQQVGRRSALLKYIAKRDRPKYLMLTNKLGIRVKN